MLRFRTYDGPNCESVRRPGVNPDHRGASITEPVILTPWIFPLLAVSEGNAAIEFLQDQVMLASYCRYHHE